MPREAVLCAWGITEDGGAAPCAPGARDKGGQASCTAFFQDLKRRGLPDRLLAITDGAPGPGARCRGVLPAGPVPELLCPPAPQPPQQSPESQWPEIAIRARAC